MSPPEDTSDWARSGWWVTAWVGMRCLGGRGAVREGYTLQPASGSVGRSASLSSAGPKLSVHWIAMSCASYRPCHATIACDFAAMQEAIHCVEKCVEKKARVRREGSKNPDSIGLWYIYKTWKIRLYEIGTSARLVCLTIRIGIGIGMLGYSACDSTIISIL